MKTLVRREMMKLVAALNMSQSFLLFQIKIMNRISPLHFTVLECNEPFAERSMVKPAHVDRFLTGV
ncbi:hypothetical protein D3C78_763430 [compost metagenome]